MVSTSRNSSFEFSLEFQVAAETNRHVVETALLALDRQEVGKRLRGMGVAAVAGVDDRDARILRGHQRRTLLEVTHGDDVGEAADHAHGVGHRLALRHRRGVGVGEADDLPAQFEHRRRETQPRAGRRLVEERGQFLAPARLAVLGAVGDNVLGQSYDLLGFGNREVCGINQMSHKLFIEVRILNSSTVPLFGRSRFTAFRRVCKPDPPLNPRLGGDFGCAGIRIVPLSLRRRYFPLAARNGSAEGAVRSRQTLILILGERFLACPVIGTDGLYMRHCPFGTSGEGRKSPAKIGIIASSSRPTDCFGRRSAAPCPRA